MITWGGRQYVAAKLPDWAQGYIESLEQANASLKKQLKNEAPEKSQVVIEGNYDDINIHYIPDRSRICFHFGEEPHNNFITVYRSTDVEKSVGVYCSGQAHIALNSSNIFIVSIER